MLKYHGRLARVDWDDQPLKTTSDDQGLRFMELGSSMLTPLDVLEALRLLLNLQKVMDGLLGGEYF